MFWSIFFIGFWKLRLLNVNTYVTDKKFPGNLTRSYRSQEPLKIIGEETEWTKPTATKRREWHENLAKNKGDIIN